MRKILLAIFILLIFLQFSFNQIAQAKVQFSPELFKNLAKNKNKVPNIDIPDYKRLKLDNGMIIYLIEDHSLPTIELTGYIKSGIRYETNKIAGISNFMFEMMNTGTKDFSEQELARYKELHGIDFSFNIANDYVKFYGNALSVDKKELVSVVANIIRKPDFKANYFKRIKQETLHNLLQAKTKEKSLLNMYFYKNIYKNHPYSFDYNLDLRKNALNNITFAKLNQFFQQTIVPNNIILGIVGDMDSEKMEQLVRNNFADWSRKEIKVKSPESRIDKNNYNKIILVNKPDATQAKIKMGYNFFTLDFNEKLPFQLANKVYGSGRFGSRLMENLRVEKGYVYGVFSQDHYYKLGGDYYITTEVKPTKIIEIIEEIRKEMLAIKTQKKKIKNDELFKIINLYNVFVPKNYNSKINMLDQIMYNVELRDRKSGYINQFIKQYNNLKLSRVQTAFAKYSYPNKFLTVIVGNKEDILPQFNKKEIKVEVINLK